MTAAIERPILFSAEMVRAILDGRKTQTRRVIKPQPDHFHKFGDGVLRPQIGLREISCPYGQLGDQLWVREAFSMGKAPNCPQGVAWVGGTEEHGRVIPHPDAPANAVQMALRWEKKPSIHMPRWASRITLEIVEVRVEQLQDISEDDANAEGVMALHDTVNGTVYRPEFQMLWDRIYARRGYSWEFNPWVWAITFKRV